MSSGSTSTSASSSTAAASVAPVVAASATPSPCLLEVCVDSVASAVAAERGGAARVELCSGLVDGGLTPSFGLIQAVRQALAIPVMVLIRPRPGDFCYSDADFGVIKSDISMCAQLGVAGVVCGVLTLDGCVDEVRTVELLALASSSSPKSLQFTFHRAFDMTRDLPAALETLMRIGVQRVLTSGGANDAITGQDVIQSLVALSAGRLTILAGGGLNEQNLAEFVRHTSVREVHGSLRSALPRPKQQFLKAGVFMGGEKRNIGGETEYEIKVADEQKIRTAMDKLQALSKEPVTAPAAASTAVAAAPAVVAPTNS